MAQTLPATQTASVEQSPAPEPRRRRRVIPPPAMNASGMLKPVMNRNLNHRNNRMTMAMFPMHGSKFFTRPSPLKEKFVETYELRRDGEI